MKGNGRDLGLQIRMAPGPDGGLYVSIPRKGGDVLALLDKDGRPRPGWPILLQEVDGCDLLLPVSDGSVRVACAVATASGGPSKAVRRAFAFDSNAQSMSGWPVDIADGSTGQMAGDDLVILVDPLLNVGGVSGELWPVSVVVIASNGGVRKGVEVTFPCCDSRWAVGPDGIAYGLTRRGFSTFGSQKADVVAVGLPGQLPGWPVTIDGNASELGVDAHGLAYLVVGKPDGRSATVVLGHDGRVLPAGSQDLDMVSTSAWNGAGDSLGDAPLVADDGSAFIVSTEGGTTTVMGLDPTGQPRDGWPYRSKTAMQWLGECGEGDTGCGQIRTAPAVGAENVLYLLQAPTSASTGGSIVAIASSGRVRSGWPVGLRRAGSRFWSMAVNTSGGVWALAIEPERTGYSATILSIADDSTVRYTTTIVEP